MELKENVKVFDEKRKAFEKAIEGLNLDFVKEEKEVKVTTPKVIVFED